MYLKRKKTIVKKLEIMFDKLQFKLEEVDYYVW